MPKALILLAVAFLAACGSQGVTKTVQMTKTETRTVTQLDRRHARPLVFVPLQGGALAYKPTRIELGAGSGVYGLKWISYGGRFATAKGRFPSRDCDPNCADGNVTWVSVVVRLKKRVACNGSIVYSLLAIVGPGFDAAYGPVAPILGPACLDSG